MLTRYRLGRMAYLRVIVVALGCLLVAGCSVGGAGEQATPTPVTMGVPVAGEATLEPNAFTDARGAPFPVPSTEANPIETVGWREAWGEGVEVKEIPGSVDPEQVLMLRAVSEDGSFVAGVLVPRTGGGSDRLKIVLMDVGSKRITEVGTLAQGYVGTASYGGSSIAVDGDWVVWQEGSTIRAYNKASRSYSQVETCCTDPSRYPDFNRIPQARWLSVDRGAVVWAEGSEEEAPAGKVRSVVKRADLETGQTTVIGKYGLSPVISWPTVAWIEPDLSTEVEGEFSSSIVTLDLETDEARTLGPPRWSLREIGAYQDWVAYAAMGAGMIFIENAAQTRRQVVAPMGGEFRTRLTMNERLVAWTSGGIPKVWDRAQERLVSLEGYAGSGEACVVNGSALAWQSVPSAEDWMASEGTGSLPGNYTIYVVDSAKLGK